MANWHEQTREKARELLKTNIEKGLSQTEAQRRLAKDGANILKESEKIRPIKMFLGQFSDLMIIVLIFAAVISAFLGEIADAVTIGTIILANGILGFIQEYKAQKSIAALKSLTNPLAVVKRNGKWQSINAAELVQGDVVKISAGDIVPADLRLWECNSLEISEAALSGESQTVNKDAEQICAAKCPLAERVNMAFMATTVQNGSGVGIVAATGMHSEIGKIAGLLENTEDSQTPLQRRLAHLGKWLVLFCFLVVAVVVAAGIYNGEDVYQMFLLGVSLAVAAIPEGLPAVVTIALALGVRRMLARRAIIRKLPAVETLGCATVICTDKTGTLTENKMVPVLVQTPINNYEIDADKSHWSLEGKWLVRCALLCNNAAETSAGKANQTEQALLRLASEEEYARLKEKNARLSEDAFDSKKKMMSVYCQNEKGESRYLKGAPEYVLNECQFLMLNGEISQLSEQWREQIEEQNKHLALKGYRVLAFAVASEELKLPKKWYGKREEGLIFLGLVALQDPLRKESVEAVAKCHQARIKVVMITGDQALTAKSIATEAGIYRKGDRIICGDELAEMSERNLRKAVEETSVYARVTPEDKLRIVKALQQNGHIVAMSGDGINDAPAINAADIGIAMGISGTEVTREAADMVLGDDNFATIVHAVEEGRGIYSNIRKFIRYLLACNIGEVLTMLTAALLFLPMPLLPIQILWVNLVTDGLPAMALGVDQKERDLMNRAPRNPKESIFAQGLGRKIAFRGIMIAFITLSVYILAFNYSFGSMEYARSAAFTTLVISQLCHVFDCRSEKYSVFETGLGNKYLILAVLCSLVMQLAVLYVPFLQEVFQTKPLDILSWAVIIFAASFMSIAFGLYRLFCRIWER